MRRAVTVAFTLVSLGLVSPQAAWAQTTRASSFDQLAGVLQVGDRVQVINALGRAYEGTLSDVSPSSIKVVGPGVVDQFTASNVASVSQLRPDSKRNGALIGLGIGAALGAGIGTFAAAEGNHNPAVGATVAGLFYGGVGALIGVGIDALSPGRKVLVYSARPAGATARLDVGPVLLPTRRALLARISF